jgi:hypothetical protein
MVLFSYVSAEFGYSYTVPLLKIKETCGVALSCEDFRGIAISSILSKIFDHCILDRFAKFLCKSDHQFGF